MICKILTFFTWLFGLLLIIFVVSVNHWASTHPHDIHEPRPIKHSRPLHHERATEPPEVA